MAKSEAKPRMGRPTTYNEDVAERICAGLSQGLTMKKVLRKRGMPARSTVYLWLEAHEEFHDAYRRAREHQAEHWADEVVDMASDAKDAVLKVTDPRLWLVSDPETNPLKLSRSLVNAPAG